MSRAEEMRGLFARWRESGQSLMAFGKQEQVSYAKLLYWRRKFAAQERGASEGVQLVPVEVVDEVRERTPSKIDVWLSNGVALEVPMGFDEAELRRLIGVLQSC